MKKRFNSIGAMGSNRRACTPFSWGRMHKKTSFSRGHSRTRAILTSGSSLDRRNLVYDQTVLVLFRIDITDMQATFKLSQNRNDVDHERIVSELEKQDEPIADVMRQHRKSRKTCPKTTGFFIFLYRLAVDMT